MGIRWGAANVNAAGLAKPVKERRYRPTVYSAEQVNALFEATRGDRLHALWVLILGAGLRLSEALGLLWEDVDTATGTIRVRHQLNRPHGGGWELGPLKSERAERSLKLPGFVRDALRDHQTAEAIGGRGQSGFVFATGNGTPYNGPNVRRSYHRALEAAGLPRIRIHDLRHSCATLLLSRGVPARVVMEQLGHSQIGLTLGTYSHVMPAGQAAAADEMDAALGA
jgi:integrase